MFSVCHGKLLAFQGMLMTDCQNVVIILTILAHSHQKWETNLKWRGAGGFLKQGKGFSMVRNSGFLRQTPQNWKWRWDCMRARNGEMTLK